MGAVTLRPGSTPLSLCRRSPSARRRQTKDRTSATKCTGQRMGTVGQPYAPPPRFRPAPLRRPPLGIDDAFAVPGALVFAARRIVVGRKDLPGFDDCF